MNSPQSDPPKKKAILPPNDPARPEWGLFSDILKQGCAPDPGSTPLQAAAKMRTLLLKHTLARKSTADALIMKCAGKQISGALKAHPQMGFDNIVAFLTQRLWNRRADGRVTPSKVGKEFSTNQVFQAWEPENGGLVKYLSVNAGMILSRDLGYTQDTIPGRVSLDAVREGSNREPDNDGHLQHRSGHAAVSDDEAPDPVEHDDHDHSMGDKDRADAEVRPGPSGRTGVDAEDGGPEGDTVAPDSMDHVDLPGASPLPLADVGHLGDTEEMEADGVSTESRRQFNVYAHASEMVDDNHPILKTSDHPDYRLLSASCMLPMPPEAEDDIGTRNEQLRELAADALVIHLVDQEQLHDQIEAVKEWVPSKASFARTFPKLTQAISESLDVVSEATVRDIPRETQAEFMFDYVALADELSRQSRRLPPQPKGVTPTEWAETLAFCQSWFKASSQDPEDLVSLERPDYRALCALNGKRPLEDATPEVMSAHLKELYSTWAGSTLRSACEKCILTVEGKSLQPLLEMNRRMESWEPLRDGYAGEMMVSHLFDIREEVRIEKEREQEAQSQTHGSGNRALSPHAAPIPKLSQGFLLDRTDISISADRSLPTPKTEQANQELIQ